MSTGERIFTLAAQHIGESYIPGIMVPMNNENWRGPWDCAEFASWLVYQTSGILYGTKSHDDDTFADAFTGYWGAQAELDDATISVEEAAGIVGAFILRKPTLEKRGHIVVSDGAGGTVEAHSRTRGVVAETLEDRTFDYGILVPHIEYAVGHYL